MKHFFGDERYSESLITSENFKAKLAALQADECKEFLMDDLLLTRDEIEAIARAIETNKKLMHVRFNNNQLSNESIGRLAQAIALNPSLREVEIINGRMDEEATRHIAQTITRNQNILFFSLKGNGIGDNEIGPVAEAIAAGTTLTRLDLSGNRIAHTGVEALVAAIEKNDNICDLAMEGNPAAAHSGVQAIESKTERNYQTALRLHTKLATIVPQYQEDVKEPPPEELRKFPEYLTDILRHQNLLRGTYKAYAHKTQRLDPDSEGGGPIPDDSMETERDILVLQIREVRRKAERYGIDIPLTPAIHAQLDQISRWVRKSKGSDPSVELGA